MVIDPFSTFHLGQSFCFLVVQMLVLAMLIKLKRQYRLVVSQFHLECNIFVSIELHRLPSNLLRETLIQDMSMY